MGATWKIIEREIEKSDLPNCCGSAFFDLECIS